MPDAAAQRRDRTPHRAAAVGVGGEHSAGLADPPRCRRERPVLRVAEDRDRIAFARPGELEGPRVQPVHAQDGHVVLRVEEHDSRVAEVTVAAVDARVLRPGDDVRVRDHEIGTRRPARALDPEPAGRPGHAQDAPARGLDAWVAQQLRIRRANARLRPADRRERIDSRDRVEQTRGRDPLVDLAQDPRALHLLAQLPSARGCAARRRPRPRRSRCRQPRRARARRRSRALLAEGA